MSMEESAKKTSRPQLVKLDRARKLAEQWVNNMTKSTEDKSTEFELEARPPRLGLGATVPRQSKAVGPLNDPVERKLHAKLDFGKRKAAKSTEEFRHDGKEEEEDDEDENLDSRTNQFSKRVVPSTSLQAKKKQKQKPK